MKAADLVAGARKALGNPYWYGTFGQLGSQSLLDAKARQYPAMYTASRIAMCRTQFGVRVWDCVGLIKGLVWDADYAGKYQPTSDLSANGMYGKCTQTGPISTIPEQPGLMVWKDGHIGVYEGAGQVIEARGFGIGVVRTALKDRPWTHWGRCHLIDYSAYSAEERLAEAQAKIAQLWGALEVQQKQYEADLHAQEALCSAQAVELGKCREHTTELEAEIGRIRSAARVLAAFADETT